MICDLHATSDSHYNVNKMADKLICVSQHQALLDKWGTNDKINYLKDKMANIYGNVSPGGIVR